MKRILVVCALGGALLAKPVLAIFGIGDIVFDPSNYEQAVQQLIQLEQQYQQLVRTYEMVRSQYDHMLRMARRVPVDMVRRYRAQATLWRNSSATNTYGSTAGWISGINSGFDVVAGYTQATQPLGTFSAFSSVPSEHRQRLKTNYATVELSDGANLHSIETLGRLRGNAPAVQAAIQGLEEDSLSPDPDMNTEIAVLNKINAAGVLALRSAQDTNQLLVAVAEQQLVQAKRIRDAETQSINNHIRFLVEGKAAMDAQAAGASAAMLAWRMP